MFWMRAQIRRTSVVRKKRSAAEPSGGISNKPILMATNAPPQMAQIKVVRRVEKRLSGWSDERSINSPASLLTHLLKGHALAGNRTQTPGSGDLYDIHFTTRA